MNEKIKYNARIPKILTLRETSEALHVHPMTLRNWDNAGKLKAFRFGGRKERRYKEGDIIRFLSLTKSKKL